MKPRLNALVATAIASLGNVVVQLLAARVLDASEFANFALSAATVLFVAGLTDTVVGQTDLIRGDLEPDPVFASVGYLLTGVTITGGMVISVVAWLVDSESVTTAGVAVMCSASFILRYLARSRAFRVSRAGWAAFSDTVVLVLSAGSLLFVTPGHYSSIGILLVWTGATAVGFLILVYPLHYWGKLTLATTWWRNNHDLAIPSTLEYFLQSAVPYALNWVILLVGGAGALAGYRIAQIVFGSLGTLAQGLSAFEIPQLSLHLTRHRIHQLLIRNAVLLMLPAAGLVAAMYGLPYELGAALFGGSWSSVPAFIVVGAFHGLLNALLIVNLPILRMLGDARYSLSIQIITVLLVPMACFGLGTYYGAVGVAWGLALTALVGYVTRLLRILTRSNDLESTAASQVGQM